MFRGAITRDQANLCFGNETMSSCYETFFNMDTMELDKRIGEAFSEASQEVPFESVTSVKLFLLAMERHLDWKKDDIVKQQRAMFLLLKRHFHICDKPDILSCANSDCKGICDSSDPHRKKRKLTSTEEKTHLSRFKMNPDVSLIAISQRVTQDEV